MITGINVVYNNYGGTDIKKTFLPLKFNSKHDWVAFMSQPYWVEVKVEDDIEAEVEMRLRWVWVEV